MIALATTTIAWIIALVIFIGWVVYAILNQGAARKELGSEIELAANRRPYYSDEELEGRRLELVQFVGVLLLAVIVVGLPLYWVFEPSRQAGATEAAEAQLASWGAELFETTANGGFNCAGCHGGMNARGGSAAGTVTDPQTGQVRSVTYIAPALDTVLYRFSEDEVRYILVYGRPGTPMSAWGLAGGGPMNAQQIDTLIAYLRTIQVPRENCEPGEADDPNCPTGVLPAEDQAEIQARAETLVADGTYGSLGEALFNLDLGGGAYSCARCHTPGWNFGEPGISGSGRLGWSLIGGVTNTHFPLAEDMEAFVAEGTTQGAGYGQGGQGTGRMPGFGALLTEEQIQAIVEYVREM
jgi:mono/diheme cytochrome c family protein